MALIYNGTPITANDKIHFNGVDLTTVYFNGVEVWSHTSYEPGTITVSSSGQFVVPPDVFSINIIAIGGGGGGASGSSLSSKNSNGPGVIDRGIAGIAGGDTVVNSIRAKGGGGGEIVETILASYGIGALEYGPLPERRKGREGESATPYGTGGADAYGQSTEGYVNGVDGNDASGYGSGGSGGEGAYLHIEGVTVTQASMLGGSGGLKGSKVEETVDVIPGQIFYITIGEGGTGAPRVVGTEDPLEASGGRGGKGSSGVVLITW